MHPYKGSAGLYNTVASDDLTEDEAGIENGWMI